jgi:hypothetical protein
VCSVYRYDLAGYIMLGGNGRKYNIDSVASLAKEAFSLQMEVGRVGMDFFIAGESIMHGFVTQSLKAHVPNSGTLHFARELKASDTRKPLSSMCACCYIGSTASTASGPEVKLLSCSACSQASYCSRACQKAHYKFHKEHCAWVKKDKFGVL